MPQSEAANELNRLILEYRLNRRARLQALIPQYAQGSHQACEWIEAEVSRTWEVCLFIHVAQHRRELQK